MAKKTPAKKPRRRLKRSVRRSLSAVLMITAIIIAAIPVPENYADNGDAAAGSMSRVTDVHDLGDFEYDADSDSGEPGQTGTNFNLKTYAGKSDEEILKDLDSKVFASYSVTNLGGGTYSLGWQFLFYEVTNPRGGGTAGAVCKYNREFYSENVNLDLYPNTEYFTFEAADYDAYFEGNLTGTAANLMDGTNPTDQVKYTYAMYKNSMVPDDFLAKYFSDNDRYKEWLQACQSYKALEDAYNKNSATAPEPDPDSKPADFTIVPATDLSTEQKLQYFCEHNKQLIRAGEGYTLFSVKDSRPGRSGGDVYLAKDGIPTTGYRNDSDGFLVLKTSDYTMCAIADQAFEGVTNVVNMEISGQIGYIGDKAFANATLLSSIKLNNVDVIGNEAFKGCVNLATADLGQTTQVIGKECFSGTKIQSIEFGNAITTIGYGAFYNCRNLTTVTFAELGRDCTIKEYAFYNCPALTSVSMEKTNIIEICDGAFAVETGSQPMGFTLPTVTTKLGNYLFAGRSSLEYVIFPGEYGRSSSVTIPPAMFHGCANLQYVEFPCDPKNDPQACGFVRYDSDKLFADVINADLYVKGPKLNNNGEPAYPRTSTWDAVTSVSNTVPYLYIDNGVEYYEVSDGTYLLCINDKGVLTSCTFKPGLEASKKKNVNLVIPSVVGNTKVTGIATGCFSDSELNENVISLKISDDSISSIADGVFQGGGGDNNKDWLKLSSVYIGNSVTSIGKNAFKKCSSLIDVTFSSPLGGYESFTIGTDAFKTESDQLTFHGDIVKGYAPFDWAMDPNNIIDSDKPDSQGIRVCYKSMAPYYLTVMYNPITQMVTLLDYPKSDQIDSILTETHKDDINTYGVSSYAEYREAYLYALYSNSNYDNYRTNFAIAWAAADEEDREELYHDDNYGPWVNANFCANWESWLNGAPDSPDDDTTSDNTTTGPDGGDSTAMVDTLTNWLFEPITVYAAEPSPKPYYEVYKYNVLDNAEANDPYRPSTPEEDYLRYAVENIVVPEGVDSIDVYGFVNNLTSEGEAYKGAESNRGNYSKYFALGWDTESRNMYTRSQGEDENTEIVPGLFSGYYVDFDGESDFEKFKRGNDTIKTVTMASVKYLPDYAFDSCEQLWYVSLGADCADIGTTPFRGCDALSSVAGNNYYEADNGIIYSKNADGSLTIEECFASRGKAGIVGQAAVSLANDPKLSQVSAIKPGAFEDCDVITSVDFGSNGTAGLTEIPDDCFKNCDKLQGVTLPITVNDIGSEAFVGANQLTELTVYGKEVKISGTAFDDSAEKLVTTVRAYDDSAVVRYVKEYGSAYKLQLNTTPLGEQWKVTFLGPDYTLIEDLKDIDGNALDNPQYVEDGTRVTPPQDPVSTENWIFDKWVGMNNVAIDDRITEDTVFYAKGFSNDGTVNGQYVVEFYDSVDGKQIGPTQYIDPGKDAVAPAYPVHAGYTFDKWSDATTNIQSNKSILALYTVSGGVNSSGNTTNTSGNTTNISGNVTNTSGNTTSSSTSTSTSTTSSSNDTTSSSNASTSTTSSETAASLYTATVIGGSGSGSYTAGTSVVIQAIPPAGQTFSRWVTESEGVSFANATAANTTFTMPASNVTITAEYIAGTAPAATTTSTDGNGGSTDGGNTRVDITKPGISNKDLATANVNGSTDNFIIKITETDEATRAVSDALTNKYGSLDNILYYAMDITLWDATGTYQLTGDQVAGITVDITIPIPDALVAYGGNNMAGAVINSNQLENLNENFTTINGVPCIRFTATHFSPYTIYVDTGNLTEGMLDATPKTGDPIHPKWFLSVGLACLSIILFMKKDKVVKVKTA